MVDWSERECDGCGTIDAVLTRCLAYDGQTRSKTRSHDWLCSLCISESVREWLYGTGKSKEEDEGVAP